MRKLNIVLILPLVGIMLLLYNGNAGAKEEPKPGAVKEPPYSRVLALKTLVNPHEQMNDEGEILWGVCLVCHKGVPEITQKKSAVPVELRVDGEFKELCVKCHTVKKHPASKDSVSASMSFIFASDHLVKPSDIVSLNMRLALKNVNTSLDLDPETGKVTCSTCHNPHEKGLLSGRGDWGADSVRRLRSEGLEICQYCHRK